MLRCCPIRLWALGGLRHRSLRSEAYVDFVQHYLVVVLETTKHRAPASDPSVHRVMIDRLPYDNLQAEGNAPISQKVFHHGDKMLKTPFLYDLEKPTPAVKKPGGPVQLASEKDFPVVGGQNAA